MDGNDEQETSKKFVRQRRNLIAISLLIIFYQSADITIQKLNILGNTVDVGNPSVISKALWAVLGYWLWRYYTLFRDRGGSGFRGALYSRIDHYCKKVAPSLARTTDYIKEIEGRYSPGIRVEIEDDVHDVIGRAPWIVSLMASTHIGESETVERINIEIENSMMWRFKIRAFFHVIAHTSVFSEYWLPYLLALTAIAYGLYQCSPAALLQ